MACQAGHGTWEPHRPAAIRSRQRRRPIESRGAVFLSALLSYFFPDHSPDRCHRVLARLTLQSSAHSLYIRIVDTTTAGRDSVLPDPAVFCDAVAPGRPSACASGRQAGQQFNSRQKAVNVRGSGRPPVNGSMSSILGRCQTGIWRTVRTLGNSDG